jgi:hypothetical protein
MDSAAKPDAPQLVIVGRKAYPDAITEAAAPVIDKGKRIAGLLFHTGCSQKKRALSGHLSSKRALS